MLEYFWQFLSSITPDSWIGKIVGGIAAAGAGSAFVWFVSKSSRYVYGTEEYWSRVQEQKTRDVAAQHNNEVVFVRDVNGTELKLFSGDITQSTAQLIVSSDDTLLSASGGVAKAITTIAGHSVRRRLRTLSNRGILRGAIAITDGGNTHFLYILHAVVLTKARDRTEYPSKSDIEIIIRRILEVADAIGVESISLPVLAGGTAAKRLKEEGLTSDQDIIRFIVHALLSALETKRRQLRTVFLVAYDNRHLTVDFIRELNQGAAA